MKLQVRASAASLEWEQVSSKKWCSLTGRYTILKETFFGKSHFVLTWGGLHNRIGNYKTITEAKAAANLHSTTANP